MKSPFLLVVLMVTASFWAVAALLSRPNAERHLVAPALVSAPVAVQKPTIAPRPSKPQPSIGEINKREKERISGGDATWLYDKRRLL